MSEEVKAAIASELALLTQLVPFPQPPFGYGSDISGSTDIDPTMAEVSGDSTLALSQALVRRLDCPRGQLPDDPNYGIGLRQMLNTGVTDQDVLQLAGQIKVELSKDDRVDAITVSVTPSSDARTLTIRLAITPIDRNVGVFQLTLNASSARLLIEEIRSAA